MNSHFQKKIIFIPTKKWKRKYQYLVVNTDSPHLKKKASSIFNLN